MKKRVILSTVEGSTRFLVLVFLTAILGFFLLLNIHPYGNNITALFHLDQTTAETLGVPKGFIVLTVPGYDGEQYYEIARSLPHVIDSPTIAYSYQRFLLPLAAHLLAFGHITLLPWAFLIINVGSLLLMAWLMLRREVKPLYVFALALSPAALIALHFNLAEPLSLLLLTAFLLRGSYTKKHIDRIDILLLSLLVLSREINIVFVAVLLAYFFFKKQWRNALLLVIPVCSFLALHGLIYAMFHEIPFLWSTGKHTLPLLAPWNVLIGARGYNVYTLSSIALLLGFVVPALLWVGLEIKRRGWEFLTLGSFVFLLLMLSMAPDIWGSITSIGRVITPVYPLTVLALAKRDTAGARMITVSILLLGLGIGFGLGLIHHPYSLS